MACECGHSKADHTRDPQCDGMTACYKCACCEYVFQASEEAQAADDLQRYIYREK